MDEQRATGFPALLRRWLVSVECLVAIAIGLTLAAVWLRDPLTTRTLQFGPGAAGKGFDSYVYDDSSNGGSSTAALEAGQPLGWSCELRHGFDWPFCGFGLLFDRQHQDRGLDLQPYGHMRVRLTYRGSGKLVRIALKDRDPRYKALPNGADKVNQATFSVRNGAQVIRLSQSDFAVADWWKDQTQASADLARPSFRNIVAMELVGGTDGELGRQDFRIEQIRFERRLISAEAFFGAIALFWIGLIAGLLQHRRRQLASIRHSAQQALRSSEHLYRSILEATTDSIVLLNADGFVELVNGSAVAAMEVAGADRVLGRHWTRLWRDADTTAVADALEEAASGSTARYRAFCPTSKGTHKWWDVVVAPLHNDDGSLKGLLSIARDITQERHKSEQLRWASEHDALTQLPNRRAFQARLQAAVLRAMETGSQVGLLLVDLDHFKHVNDALGHGAGDDLLKSIAERLREGVREGDFVARIGGDEFAMILEPLSSDDDLLSVGAHLHSVIHATTRIGGRALRAGASIGGAVFPKNGASANDLFKNADTALYSLKQDGRGGTRLFASYMLMEAEKSASQLRLARGAVTGKAVVPFYQPKFRVEDGAMTGLEALLRWRHPRKGLQLPGTVEEAFGDYELASRIGDLMQRRVAEDMRCWLDSGLDVGRVAINAAPAEFLRDDYAEHLLSVIAGHQVPAELVEVEITEHAFLGRANDYVARALAVLKAAGVTIALDDFGTGSSSLSHLRDFPVDVVKIDMSFVQRMTEDAEIAAIVTAVVRLARSLSIEVVAEGVEKPAQLDFLRAMGCHLAQGHLFTAAVEASRVPSLMPRSKAAA